MRCPFNGIRANRVWRVDSDHGRADRDVTGDRDPKTVPPVRDPQRALVPTNKFIGLKWAAS